MALILIIFSPFIILLLIIIEYLISACIYRTTGYYKVTHKKYFSVRFNKGFLGEYLIYKKLKQFERQGASFLFNCYIPRENGKTTEIDVIMLYRSGIYIFESKNYGGWIFGSENSRTWTQTLPNGRTSRKEHFLNPIIQNRTHIKYLKAIIGTGYPMYSLIVFSDRCTFMDVDLNPKEADIIYRKHVKQAVSLIDSNITVGLSDYTINEIYTKLYPFTQQGDDVKEKHIEDIRTSLETGNSFASATNDNICPKCGGRLVLRTAKQGLHAGEKFYGCSNYPSCRYIRNL